jgi:hypothetical protein
VDGRLLPVDNEVVEDVAVIDLVEPLGRQATPDGPGLEGCQAASVKLDTRRVSMRLRS